MAATASKALMRREYELTVEQMKKIVIASHTPLEQRKQAVNEFWQKLADELGFDMLSVWAVPGKSSFFFSALAVGCQHRWVSDSDCLGYTCARCGRERKA